MTATHEIAVVGGGLTGACVAALLVHHGRIAPERIVLLASGPPEPLPAGAPALRVAAISRASERVLRAAQAWTRLNAARLCPYERMRVWHESAAPAGAATLCFDAADIGEPNLGFIAENSALTHACMESFRASGGTLVHSSLSALAVTERDAQLTCEDGATLTVRLVVGADGAQSLVRERVGLTVRRREYRQAAIVATVRSARPHEYTAWQRFLHTGPLALLPLFDGSCSIVWSADDASATELRDCPVSEFNRRLDAASSGVLGETQLMSERLSFPLRSMAAHSYIAPRCALIGDAAHVIHPLAGLARNLGLLDAAALCGAVADAIAQREDPGAMRVLRGYEQQRRTHNLLMDAAMSALQSGFAAARGPGAWLLNRALTAVNRSAALKRAFAQQALGTAGELPRLARG